MLRHSTRTIGRLEEAVASVLLYGHLEDQSDALDGSAISLCVAFAKSPSWLLEDSNALGSS